MKIRIQLPVLLALGSLSCQPAIERVGAGIEGAWQVKAIESKLGSEPANDTPVPSLFLFMAPHYSIVWMPRGESQRAFADHWHPTDAEKLARYGAVVVNGGTYENH